jgi:hypothetical protein
MEMNLNLKVERIFKHINSYPSSAVISASGSSHLLQQVSVSGSILVVELDKPASSSGSLI